MLGQPGLSNSVHGEELGDLPRPYSNNMAKCEVWPVLPALKRCDLVFCVLFILKTCAAVLGGGSSLLLIYF